MAKAFLKGELDKEFSNLEHINIKPSKNKKSIIEPKSTSCHGVKKATKRSQSKHLNAKSTRSFIGQKNFIHKDPENSDKTNDNVRKLLALSESSQMSSCSKSNIINHTDKSKRHYEPKSRNFLKNLKRSKPKKESSLFTEEDFDRFSKEYFLNSEPINKSSLDKMKQKEMED